MAQGFFKMFSHWEWSRRDFPV